ncbi:MaoC family dehydratase [Sphingomonas sp. DBB INV C78]|uniref:MaoC family dehydratase n=1 Tax=Sphingomonas sp. DBB INV C78 TaxID=3349434 RepID=UPI0036D3286E
MQDFLAAIEIGAATIFSKTVTESDVSLFAGISGDFARNHVDEAYMRRTPFGGRIAHGLLLLGYTSRASTLMCEACLKGSDAFVPLALGFDRVRFLRPVLIGETITVRYAIEAVDAERGRMTSAVTIENEAGEPVLAATHIVKWVAAEG